MVGQAVHHGIALGHDGDDLPFRAFTSWMLLTTFS